MSNTLLADDGSTLPTEPSQLTERRREYSDRLSNAEVAMDEEVLQEISPFPLRYELDDPPTMEEVRIAIQKTRANKSPRPDGIPAETYK